MHASEAIESFFLQIHHIVDAIMFTPANTRVLVAFYVSNTQYCRLSLVSLLIKSSNNAVINRARRHRYCPPNLPTLDELCDTADDELFSKVVRMNTR